MIRNPEQTIGKLADHVSDVVCSFIDDQGYPETWTLPQACRREGICRFWFEVKRRRFLFRELINGQPAFTLWISGFTAAFV